MPWPRPGLFTRKARADPLIDAARKGLEHEPAHLEARYELGLALEGKGLHEEARAELEQDLARYRAELERRAAEARTTDA